MIVVGFVIGFIAACAMMAAASAARRWYQCLGREPAEPRLNTQNIALLRRQAD